MPGSPELTLALVVLFCSQGGVVEISQNLLQSGSHVKFHYILIMKPFPHLLLQVEVMVNVENQLFPILVIVVIRVLLVPLGDVAIGTDLGKMQGSLGRATRDGGSR